MTPQHPSLAAMMATFLLASIAIAVALILSGCAIPIPPSGEKMGELGTITIQVGYVPNQLSLNDRPLPASTTTK
jgi:outer membrane protein assembly factor BamE (lipoprotein component of BamABCDE complex)